MKEIEPGPEQKLRAAAALYLSGKRVSIWTDSDIVNCIDIYCIAVKKGNRSPLPETSIISSFSETELSAISDKQLKERMFSLLDATNALPD